MWFVAYKEFSIVELKYYNNTSLLPNLGIAMY